MGNDLAQQRDVPARLDYLVWALSIERDYNRGRFDGLEQRHLMTALERWFGFVTKNRVASSSNQRERNTILREFNEIAPYTSLAGSGLTQLVADFGGGLRYVRSDRFADYSIDELKTAYDDAIWWRTIYSFISEILTYSGFVPAALPAAGRMLAAWNAARAAALVSRAAGPAGWVLYGASVAATLAASRMYSSYISQIEFEIEGNRIPSGEITAAEWDAFESTINDDFDSFSVVD